MSSVSALFSCQFPHPAPLRSPAPFYPWHMPGIGSECSPSSLPAVSQFSTACTTCPLSWNPNSCAPVSCLQRRRMLSSNSVQFKITKILLPLCLNDFFSFSQAIHCQIIQATHRCCSLYYTSHAATGPAIMNPSSV